MSTRVLSAPRPRFRQQRYLPKMEELASRERSRTHLRGRGLLTVPPEPYSGPREFALSTDTALRASGAAPRPQDVFWIRRDEELLAPYGGFHIYWRGHEIGRTLSWPDLEVCRRLRRTSHIHPTEES